MTGSRAAGYAEILMHLRASQVLGRARRLVPPRVLAAGRARRDVSFRPLAAGLGVDPAPQSGPLLPPHVDGIFRAVGAERAFVPERRFWVGDDDGLLFLFSLHDFRPLAAYCAGGRDAAGDGFWAGVLKSWLRSCGRPGLPAWHPYPTSGRLISWCAALSSGEWPAPLERALLSSLAAQTRYLSRAVEHDVGGNHLLHNGMALWVAAMSLGDTRLRPRAERLLHSQCARQILVDGAHEERSSSYQRSLAHELTEVAEVCRRAGEEPPAWLLETASRMEGWLDALTGPDGRVPLFNDAWEGPLRTVAAAPEPVVDLRGSGHVVLQHGDDKAVLDVGPLGPDHLPAHAHSDALSVELWADGRPLVADPGAFAYAGEARDAFRATRAHATVELDGRSQCRFLGPFRAAHLPEVRVRTLERRPDGIVRVVGEHDGFRRLPDPAVHVRTFWWLPGEGLVVVDRIESAGQHRVRSALPLHPSAAPVTLDRIGPFALRVAGGLQARIAAGRYAPHIGTAEPCSVVLMEGTVAPEAPFGWSLLRDPLSRLEAIGSDLHLLRPDKAPLALAD